MSLASPPTTSLPSFRYIGAGQCGTIFEIPGAPRVYKIAKRIDDYLWIDYCIHLRIFEACEKISHSGELGFRVTAPHFFVSDIDEEWWEVVRQRFPGDYRHSTSVLCTERVWPIAKPLRDALISEYCPESLRASACNTPGELDCLAREYLGKKCSQSPRLAKPTWSLRNYSLYLD